MKKVSLFIPAILLLSFVAKWPAPTLSDTERKYASDLLLQTAAGVQTLL